MPSGDILFMHFLLCVVSYQIILRKPKTKTFLKLDLRLLYLDLCTVWLCLPYLCTYSFSRQLARQINKTQIVSHRFHTIATVFAPKKKLCHLQPSCSRCEIIGRAIIILTIKIIAYIIQRNEQNML